VDHSKSYTICFYKRGVDYSFDAIRSSSQIALIIAVMGYTNNRFIHSENAVAHNVLNFGIWNPCGLSGLHRFGTQCASSNVVNCCTSYMKSEKARI
jgi:hypothetical protein